MSLILWGQCSIGKDNSLSNFNCFFLHNLWHFSQISTISDFWNEFSRIMQSFGSVPDLTQEVLGINNPQKRIKKCQSIPNLDQICNENGGNFGFKDTNIEKKVNNFILTLTVWQIYCIRNEIYISFCEDFHDHQAHKYKIDFHSFCWIFEQFKLDLGIYHSCSVDHYQTISWVKGRIQSCGFLRKFTYTDYKLFLVR